MIAAYLKNITKLVFLGNFIISLYFSEICINNFLSVMDTFYDGKYQMTIWKNNLEN